jgi:hypothetical protein
MFMMTPAWGMLFNTKEKRWHPILFVESPLPGPSSDDKPIRLKSKGHHTTGFATREEALAEIKKISADIQPDPIMDLEKDIPWDGEDIPAMVVLLADKKLVLM